MKIAVMNFSGNVGKTTIAAHLLKPRMPNARVYSVESINAGADASGVEVEKLRGKKFGSLIDAIMMLDEAIIDVGASNVEDFMKMMQQFDGSHEEIDLFIVPTLKEKKVQADTVNTVRALRTLGIPAKKSASYLINSMWMKTRQTNFRASTDLQRERKHVLSQTQQPSAPTKCLNASKPWVCRWAIF